MELQETSEGRRHCHELIESLYSIRDKRQKQEILGLVIRACKIFNTDISVVRHGKNILYISQV